MKESTVSNLAVPQAPPELPVALQEPTHAKSLLFMALYTIASMVVVVCNIPIASILLPEHIATLTSGNYTSIFSLILGLGAVAAVLTSPVAGIFSGCTTLRRGRPRPLYIAGGAPSEGGDPP